MEIKEKYSELSKKHKLPSFEELDIDFEISTIESDEFLLREVRRKITDKLELFVKFLEEILQPEATVCNMYESKAFNESERQNIFKLYKRLMFLDRLSIETAVNEDEEKSSKYINAVFEDWNEIKTQFSRFVTKAKESWLKDSDIKEELGYMG